MQKMEQATSMSSVSNITMDCVECFEGTRSAAVAAMRLVKIAVGFMMNKFLWGRLYCFEDSALRF